MSALEPQPQGEWDVIQVVPGERVWAVQEGRDRAIIAGGEEGWRYEVHVQGHRLTGVLTGKIGDAMLSCEMMLAMGQGLDERDPDQCGAVIGLPPTIELCRARGIMRCPVRGYAVCAAHLYTPMETEDEMPLHPDAWKAHDDCWGCMAPDMGAEPTFSRWFVYDWRCPGCVAAAEERVCEHGDGEADYYQRFGMFGEPLRVKLGWLVERARAWESRESRPAGG